MTEEQDPLRPSGQMIVDRGTDLIVWLLGGPAVWEETPAPFLRPEDIGSSIAIASMHPETLNSSWLETQRVVAQTAVNVLVHNFAHWAEDHDRPDFFATVGELLAQAVAASDSP